MTGRERLKYSTKSSFSDTVVSSIFPIFGTRPCSPPKKRYRY